MVHDFSSLEDIQRMLSTGSLSCRDLVDLYLERIAAHAHLNAFVEVYAESAQAAARRLDARRAAGPVGRLAGLVLGVKDVVCHQGHGLGAASRILEGFTAQFTATALQKLLDEDAIVIGRLSCDEFAMGSSNEHAAQGPVQNPLDTRRVPGGSSGGSAAAVAAGLCHAALGSDTGGSVRQPAAFCDVVGLKPTYGRISRWGLIAYASSFDQIGPITRSVSDAALLLDIMSGADPRDNTSVEQPRPGWQPPTARPRPQRIGYIRETLEGPGLDPDIGQAVRTVMERLEAAGHELIPLDFPLMEYLVPCYYILTTAEASSNLNRYDGIRYGFRQEGAQDLDQLYRQSRTAGFGAEVKRRIMLGTFVLSAGYFDAYYTRAMKVRRQIQEATQALFAQCDVLLTPTAPGPAFMLGEKQDDPIAMYLSDVFTVHANLAGVPAISLPMGLHPAGGGMGLQLMAPSWGERALLESAYYLEQHILSSAT